MILISYLYLKYSFILIYNIKILEILNMLNKIKNAHKKLLNKFKKIDMNHVDAKVLGLNDALIEMIGALAGYTLALQKTKLIAMIGLITGIAAALSMSASEYLSKKADKAKKPYHAAMNTGLTYLITVFILVIPFLLFTNQYFALFTSIVLVALVVFCFTFVLSIAKDINFKKRFFEMLAICLIIASISFIISYIIKGLFNINLYE
jgi:vacuolar iron transporter family protein